MAVVGFFGNSEHLSTKQIFIDWTMKIIKLALKIIIIFMSILFFVAFISLPTDGGIFETSKWLDKLSENLFELVKHIIGEVLGFLALGSLFVYFFKRELIDVIEKGMRSLASIFSENLCATRKDAFDAAHSTFANHISPVLDEFKRMAILTQSIGGHLIKEETQSPKNIMDELKIIHEKINDGEFEAAEGMLLALKSEHTGDLSIINEIHSFYSGNLCQSRIVDCKRKLLTILKDSERFFDKEPSFYKLLGFTYIESRDILPIEESKIYSFEALQRGKLLDRNNPRWDISIGFYHYIFDNIDDALRSTEDALRSALQTKESGGQEIIACIELAKNNIAFYLACKKEKKDIAFEYANSAYKHFSQSTNEEIAMVKDTLGFVYLQFSNNKEDIDKAIELLSNALRLDPSQDSYAHRLQLAYQKTKALYHP